MVVEIMIEFENSRRVGVTVVERGKDRFAALMNLKRSLRQEGYAWHTIASAAKITERMIF
jgi:hypothetical protein